jgi:hypothetical protein
MLDHEEKFLFKEEILHLANAVAEPGVLDNVEDLLTDVITSPRFDSEVFTLERSLQVMLGPRAGTTLVGLLTVTPEVFDVVEDAGLRHRVREVEDLHLEQELLFVVEHGADGSRGPFGIDDHGRLGGGQQGSDSTSRLRPGQSRPQGDRTGFGSSARPGRRAAPSRP